MIYSSLLINYIFKSHKSSFIARYINLYKLNFSGLIMSKESDLEEIVRLKPVGSHKDLRREIIDFPVGYLHGANVAVGHAIRLANTSKNLPLGQHFHTNYGEIFALVQGRGVLYVRVVVPGEINNIKPEIVVPEVISQHHLYEGLRGIGAELKMDSTDLSN